MWIHLPAISSLVYLALVIYVALQENSRGNRLLLLVLILSFFWPFLYYAEMVAETMVMMQLISIVRFAIFPLIPMSICMLLLHLTGIGERLSRWIWGYLWGMPVVLAVFSLSSGMHSLFRYDFAQVERYGYLFMQAQEGPLFLIYILYAYTVSILNVSLLVWWYNNGTFWARRQALLLIVASVLPALFDIGRMIGIEPVPGFNLAPATLGISGSIIVWAVLGYRLAQASPVARTMLLDMLPSIVVVLDDMEKIVDVNQQACKALGMSCLDLPLMMPDRLNMPWKEWLRPIGKGDENKPEELMAEIDGQQRYFERSVHPLRSRDRLIGHLIYLDDVTEFREANLALAERERMREQASLLKDLHDGVGGLAAHIGLLAQLAMVEDSSAARETSLRGIMGLAQEMGVEVRRFISMLEQPDYGWSDWMLEIRTFCRTALDGLPISLHLQIGAMDGLKRTMRADIGLSVYRLIKECVTNVIKHAHAEDIWVTVDLRDECLFVEVQDNGCGFQGLPERQGGISNMRERVRRLGGEIETQVDHGVCHRVRIPQEQLWRQVVAGGLSGENES